MSAFTEKEIEYLGTQRLGRLATIDSAGNPHVVPVGFRYNPETDTIDIGGRRTSQTRTTPAQAAARPASRKVCGGTARARATARFMPSGNRA